MIRITYDEGNKLLNIEMKDIERAGDAMAAYMAIFNGMAIHFGTIFGREAMEKMLATMNALERAGIIGFSEEDADEKNEPETGESDAGNHRAEHQGVREAQERGEEGACGGC